MLDSKVILSPSSSSSRTVGSSDSRRIFFLSENGRRGRCLSYRQGGRGCSGLCLHWSCRAGDLKQKGFRRVPTQQTCERMAGRLWKARHVERHVYRELRVVDLDLMRARKLGFEFRIVEEREDAGGGVRCSQRRVALNKRSFVELCRAVGCCQIEGWVRGEMEATARREERSRARERSICGSVTRVSRVQSTEGQRRDAALFSKREFELSRSEWGIFERKETVAFWSQKWRFFFT